MVTIEKLVRENARLRAAIERVVRDAPSSCTHSALDMLLEELVDDATSVECPMGCGAGIHDAVATLRRALDEQAERLREALATEDASTPALAPVPRGHCDRCDRCGWPLAQPPTLHSRVHGCTPANCSHRPLPPRRSTCAGCGAPYAP